MSAYEVERAYAAWAREARFVEYEGEAFYHGTIDGHAVVVDDGTRGERCYPPQARIVVEITEPRGVVAAKHEESTPVREKLRRVLAEEKPLQSVRLDDGELALEFGKDTEPQEMARILVLIVAACRIELTPVGPYR
ncbi:MAG: hypothetical protein JST00_05260 [Deltaproteobacteria bacterium]|nr:hypothetical protein [Deltaproteobacteria bacterium]